MRVFLDTNVLVAAFATRGLCADVVRVVLVHHELVVTEVVLKELRRALEQKIGLPAASMERAVELLEPHVVRASGERESGSLPIRDASDVEVVASAIAAKAELIVSGDRDLLEAALPIVVLSPRAFWEKLRPGVVSGEVHEG